MKNCHFGDNKASLAVHTDLSYQKRWVQHGFSSKLHPTFFIETEQFILLTKVSQVMRTGKTEDLLRKISLVLRFAPMRRLVRFGRYSLQF